LILAKMHDLRIPAALIWPVVMPWLLFALGLPTCLGIAMLLRFSKLMTGALILTAGNGNTSFVGQPMIYAFYGPKHFATGILIDR
jgi:hypothetical protein